MKIEIGTIKYGNLRFIFNILKEVEIFLNEKEISLENVFPKTQFFYQGVLGKLGLNHNEKKDLEVIFYSMKKDGEGVEEEIEEEYELFTGFPVHVRDKIYLAHFGVKVK